MKILYLADPNSIHDIRWIGFFAKNPMNKCYMVVRDRHINDFDTKIIALHPNIEIVAQIEDPSTVRPWKTYAGAVTLKKLVSKYDIDVVHILYAEPNGLWAAWRRYLKIPIVITTRGTDILVTIPAFFRKRSLLAKAVAWHYRFAFRQASMVTGTSSDQLKSMAALSGRQPFLIRTGVDFGLIDRIKENPTPVEFDKPHILMPRSLRPLYNHDLTLDAIARLDPSIRQEFCFVFLNADTKDVTYAQHLMNKASMIAGDIRFLPSMHYVDVLTLFKSARLVVMNPLSDGSPVSAMEAMACQVPVIIPPLTYDPEIFQDVLQFDEWTPDALAKKITEALNLSDDAIRVMREKNFMAVFMNGNWETEMRKLEQLYSQII